MSDKTVWFFAVMGMVTCGLVGMFLLVATTGLAVHAVEVLFPS